LGEQHTILLSTHILSEVEAVCRRVIIINVGRIGLDKKLAELATDEAVIVLEVRGPAEQVHNVLRTTEGVAQVVPQPLGDGLVGFEVRTHQHRDLREALCQRIAKNGWTLRRLDLRRRTLEDHFIDVVRRDEEAYLDHSGGFVNQALQDASAQGALAARKE
jgi:ABC-2 type transport system ATP-binding protein